jgi:hypothetical protein
MRILPLFRNDRPVGQAYSSGRQAEKPDLLVPSMPIIQVTIHDPVDPLAVGRIYQDAFQGSFSTGGIVLERLGEKSVLRRKVRVYDDRHSMSRAVGATQSFTMYRSLGHRHRFCVIVHGLLK